FLIVTVALSKIPVKALFKGMKPLVMILIFTGILNLLFTTGETVLVSFWRITITLEGVIRAFFMVMRILMLISATFLLTYTTSPIQLTDGLESLLTPLKKIRVPVHELAMMMCIALRFIPTQIEETDKIISAQKARGADFETGKLMERIKALIPILVPLFISAFRRADELATAMECRCYQGGEGRTKMKLLRFRRFDYIAFLLLALLLCAVILAAQLGL
ncbi:MAG: energy-coupling factor transporter transmembrane protein EcfT, partial [Oscillospiraceae bacterium]|nr:energy-coupling factor transporter transmembrane protein EcfT [Oscillospiraceae bacterium]